MQRRASRFTSLALALLSSACVLPDADLDGLPCPCAEGYVCDAVKNECVPGGVGGQGAGPGPTTGGAGGEGAIGAGAAGGAGPGGAGGGPGGGGAGGGGEGPGGQGGGAVCGDGVLDQGEACDPPAEFICGSDCEPILSGNEDCSDGVDNDSDQQTDCEDGDCACTCAEPIQAATVNGSNEGNPAVNEGFCVGIDGNPETLFTYTPAFSGALDIELFSPEDQGVYVRTDCDDPFSEIGCVDQTGGSDTERLIVPAGEGEALTIFVDSYVPGAAGTFAMSVSLEPLDESEPNDALGTADPLPIGPGGATGMIHPVGDEDHFTFTLAEETFVSLDIVPFGPVPCTFDSEVTLLDDEGGLVEYDDDGGDEGCSSLSTVLDAGTYFVRVGSPQMQPNQASFVYRVILDD